MAVGVFGLQVAYKLKRTELLSSEDTHGWFGGGLSSTTLSTADRIDFSNDTSTSTPRGALSVARRSLSAVGNSNFGWFGGGWFTPSSPQINYSTIDRIDFSNDSATALARGPLASTRYVMAATANSNYGWFGGGQLFDPVTPANTRKSSVDRIDFSNDSPTASPRGPLSLVRSALAATGNSNFGWFGGGVNPSTPAIFSTVDRIDFSNDSPTASPRGPLSSLRASLAATGNSNYGWFGGGYTTGVVNLSTVDRIDFANDSIIASIRGPLTSTSRNRFAATGNSNYGWFGGGTSAVDRIDFSNDLAIVSGRASLSSTRENPGATSGQAKFSSILLQKAGNFGWWGGGRFQFNPSTWATFSTVDRIDFSNDSATASIRGPLGRAVSLSSVTGNSNFGWFGGGLELPGFIVYSTVSRIDFSNDSSTATVRGSLNSARSNLAATGNSNYGWFGGGYDSRVNRINFLNDLFSATLRGSSNLARGNLAATGNSNFGWFGGGITPTPAVVSTVERIDFSNDSSTATVRGPLNSVRFNLGATGNFNYGWFGGGYNTSISRIDFSNDSSTASPRSTLITIQSGGSAATGNSNYGWFGGGYDSRVNRINFSNDSSIALQRGNLSVNPFYSSTSTRGFMGNAATSNTPIG